MGLMVGSDDFGEVMDQQLGFIDKSLFIKEIFDRKDIKASVIVRPRRFGKTFNMSMLHHFLAEEVNQFKTKRMFDNLKIAQAGDYYMDQQGKYPVIFVSFKSMSHNEYDKAKQSFAKLISQLYGQHRLLLSNEALYSDEKAAFERILNQEASDADLTASLLDLSGYLYRYYKVKPWLLIDEYDTPIQSGYLNGYYDLIIEFMRGLFGSALKSNNNIHRAVITGILRISKESLFSGVNNIKVFSILNSEYSEHFGFTEKEVDAALKNTNLTGLSSKIKSWYNGYHIGNQQVYNPWSIANCIYEKGSLKPYWINTSSNDLIKESMAKASAAIKEKFELILEDKPIEAIITENMVFADLKTNSDALWSLLLFSGYLTPMKIDLTEGRFNCWLQTPNQEVATLYRNVIRDWFGVPLGRDKYHYFLKSLTEGRLDEFLKILKRFLKESTSCFDAKGHHPEKFYHGFVLGLIVSLSDTHNIQSNKESGDGRYDVLIIPKDKEKLGLVLEFKTADEGVTLKKTAEQALVQINEREYAIELQQKGIHKILKIGLAFRGKEVDIAWLSH